MRPFSLSCAVLMLLAPVTANAKPAFVGSVPNGSTLSCNTCHVAGSPKSVRNDFGIDVDQTLKGGMPDWPALCELDSDGDGATNGEELQDMLCEWVSGANPGCSALVTAPGDANSVPANSFCGDGTCNAGENDACCAADCMCGNGECDDSEDFESCPDDCDAPPPPPVDEDETDAGSADDVMEEDAPSVDDAMPEEDVSAVEDTSVPVPPEDVLPADDTGASDDAGVPSQDVDPGPSEDAGSDPPPADTGTPPADVGSGSAPEPADDGGCAINQNQPVPPVWMALLAFLFIPFVLRRREY